MSCKCKNIIENFQGGTIPLDTSFLGNVDICGTGSTLSVSNLIGCSPITIGSDSGCTSGNTTLIVSGSSVFSCDIDVLGGIYSGGTNLIDIFSSGGGGDLTTVLTAGNTTGGNDIIMTEGDDVIFKYAGFNNNINTQPITTNRNILFPDNDGVVALTSNTGDVSIKGNLNINDINFISGTTGNTVSTLGIDNSGNVVEQKKVVTVTLGPSELIGSVAGTNYLPPIPVPPNKYAKVTVHRIYTYNSVAYDGSLVFGLTGPSSTYYALPAGGGAVSNTISEGVNFVYLNPPSVTTPQFGIWHSVGTAPTVGDATMKFRLEYEFFDL